MKQGMSIIETLDTAGFTDYLKKYGNTICGRHPIGVLLNVLHLFLLCMRRRNHETNSHSFFFFFPLLQMVDQLRGNTNGLKMSLKFVDYAQSSQCRSFSDSSVSYASAALVFE